MMTFFGQVVRPSGCVDVDDEILLWLGSEAREVLTVEALQAGLSAYRSIPPDILLLLRRDRIASVDRGPSALQRKMVDLLPKSDPPPYDGFAVGFHVLCQEPDGEWFYHLPAATEREAEDEASSLLRDGCKAKIMSGPINIEVELALLNRT